MENNATIIADIHFEVCSVNISEKKGVVKHPVEQIKLNKLGVEHDAHAGTWHRQVSILGQESINKFSELAGRTIKPGEFAENISTKGICLYELNPLDRIAIGNTELEVTQIGKKCHGDTCAIFREVGNCVMPKEGIFCRVLKEGIIEAGMKGICSPKIHKALIITLSDRASKGEYADRSGPAIAALLEAFFKNTKKSYQIDNKLIPDDTSKLMELLDWSENQSYDFVFLTGGTGIGPRDISPEVLKNWIDKEIPGIMEMIRVKYGQQKPAALLSRSIAGIKNNCLAFALPGSVRAVEEYCNEIIPLLNHAQLMLHSIDAH